MSWTATLGSFGVALGVGLMVGLERERASSKQDADWFGGIRTFAIVGLVGAMFGLIGQVAGGWFSALGVGLTCGVLFLPALLEVRLGQRAGITSEVACTVVLMLGMLAMVPVGVTDDPQRWRLVAAGGVAVMGLLTMRKPLHRLAGKVSRDDLYATAKLAVMLLIVLPILPDVGFGPGGRVNPFRVGLLVSLIAAIGFAGYLAVRVLGSSKGMAVTGLLGGLVSSTAVTLSFSGRVKEQPELIQTAALGIILASSVMVPRVLVLSAIVSPSLLGAALVPVGSMGLVAFAMAGVLYYVHRQSPDENPEVELENPFSLSQAMKFGAVFLVVLVVTAWLTEAYGSGALYVSAALSAATSVDAITLTVAELHADGLPDQVAVTALLIGCISNTVVKVGLGLSLGGTRLGTRLLGVFIPMLAAGILALVFTL
ncbi:MAG TPA: MgtC/SapB family protein [Myxococcota bacterium]|nr:MgtC/SapB family protein [Myxococcota bacterium]